MSIFTNANKPTVHGGRFVEAGVYNEVNVNGRGLSGLEILRDHTASAALHNAGECYDPPKCHPDTRVAVLDRILQWADSSEHEHHPIFWLYGAAGAGKSAIAQTLADRWYGQQRLAASFFFSRTDSSRNSKIYFLSTITYQLLEAFPDIRLQVEQSIEEDPLIFAKSLEVQMNRLIVLSLKKMKTLNARPKIIIIDGLDECTGEKAQEEILMTFASALKRHNIPLILLVASRPEPQIRSTFDNVEFKAMAAQLVLDEEFNPSADITLYLQCKFAEIKQRHDWLRHTVWPPTDAIHRIVEKSSGHFIYASTVIKYISAPRGDPRRCLEIILGIKNPGQDTPYAELDALYTYILSCVSDASLDIVMNILASLITREDMRPIWPADEHPNSPEFLEKLLLLEQGQISVHLIDLHSLLKIPPTNHPQKPITVFHASFSDFLSDRNRSQSYYIGKGDATTRLATCLWKHIMLQLSVQQVYPQRRGMKIDALHTTFRTCLDKALPDESLTLAMLAAIGNDNKPFLEALAGLGLEHLASAKEVSFLHFVKNCDVKASVLGYLKRCNMELETSQLRKLAFKQRLAKWGLESSQPTPTTQPPSSGSVPAPAPTNPTSGSPNNTQSK